MKKLEMLGMSLSRSGIVFIPIRLMSKVFVFSNSRLLNCLIKLCEKNMEKRLLETIFFLLYNVLV